ncbi:MAG: hypothetical protein M1457_11515 [bacterium]|nr:hypothetical protein [bacterium]
MATLQSIKGGDKKGETAEAKPVKYKLTKEQTQYVNGLVKLESRIAICREYIALWMNFFRMLSEDIGNRDYTANEEKAFFQVMTILARKHFLFVEMMGDTFERGNDILSVLVLAVGLSHARLLPENTRSKLELDWHSLFLDMNKALGRLLRMLPGKMTLAEAIDWANKNIKMGENGLPLPLDKKKREKTGGGLFGKKK